MKRLFILVFCCFTLSQTTQANTLTADSNQVVAKHDTIIPAFNAVPLTAWQNTYKRRLDSVQKDVPLNYNEYVQTYIDAYTNRKNDIGRILGLAKYYFPIYEKAFREAGIPEEIKFLSIVESELNPNAVSRVGATGPWQFMAATGKNYGLNVDEYVDDRRDPIKASYAAAAYLRDAYQEFGDWLLAIASYNCGKSSVERAIDKSGGATDFWSIRPFLPQETRGYVPAYIAVSYVMNYFAKHNITAQSCNFNTATDTLMVNKMVSLSGLAKALQLDAREVAILNPSYKRGVINGSTNISKRLILPKIATDKYGALYEVLNSDGPNANYTPAIYAANTAEKAVAVAATHPAQKPAYHKIRRGETLADIADEYGVEVQDLKAWNNLHSSRAVAGTKLKLSENTGAADDDAPAVKKSAKYVTYKVRRGDTLSRVAEKFEASIDSIKELNGLKRNSLQPGMMLKITKV